MVYSKWFMAAGLVICQKLLVFFSCDHCPKTILAATTINIDH